MQQGRHTHTIDEVCHAFRLLPHPFAVVAHGRSERRGPMSPDSSAIRRRLERQSVYLRPPPELDLATVAEFAERLQQIQTDEDVVIDLRELRFCGAAGLRVLLDARRRAEDIGATITLSHPCAAFDRLLVIAGLSNTFTIARPVPSRQRRLSGTDNARR